MCTILRYVCLISKDVTLFFPEGIRVHSVLVQILRGSLGGGQATFRRFQSHKVVDEIAIRIYIMSP